MIDNIYRNSFKEINDILNNTDEQLLKKIPKSFRDFITSNMNVDYKTNINFNEDIDKQSLSKETEGILSLIYRSYWATDDEKKELAQKDKREKIDIENKKQENYSSKDIYEIFEKRKEKNSNLINNNLMVIKKESFIKKIFNKIFKFLQRT